jgi:hypothetical protein
LPGDNEDLCAGLEVFQVVRNEPHDWCVGRHNDFLLAIKILHYHDLAHFATIRRASSFVSSLALVSQERIECMPLKRA